MTDSKKFVSRHKDYIKGYFQEALTLSAQYNLTEQLEILNFAVEQVLNDSPILNVMAFKEYNSSLEIEEKDVDYMRDYLETLLEVASGREPQEAVELYRFKMNSFIKD